MRLSFINNFIRHKKRKKTHLQHLEVLILSDWPSSRPSSPSSCRRPWSSSPSSSPTGRRLSVTPLLWAVRPPASASNSLRSGESPPLQARLTGDPSRGSFSVGSALPLCWSSSLEGDGVWSASTWPLLLNSNSPSGAARVRSASTLLSERIEATQTTAHGKGHYAARVFSSVSQWWLLTLRLLAG